MNLYFNLKTVINLVSIFQGLVLCGLLLNVRNRGSRAPTLLALLLLMLTLLVVSNFLAGMGLYQAHYQLAFLPLHYYLALGPVVYFYVRSTLDPHFGFTRANLLLFIPAALELAYYVCFWVAGEATRSSIAQRLHGPLLADLERYGAMLLLSAALFRSARHWQQARRAEGYPAGVTAATFRWLGFFLLTLTVSVGVWVAETVLPGLFVWILGTRLIDVLLPLNVYVIALKGYVFYRNATDGEWETPEPGKPAEPQPVVKDQLIEAAEVSVYTERLTKIMELEKPHLDPLMSLEKLARLLEINPKALSYVLNNGLNKSFSTFVNEYRVEEVKKKLLDCKHDHLTIVGMACESGFNSEASFYRVFKKITGVSATEFKMQVRNEQASLQEENSFP